MDSEQKNIIGVGVKKHNWRGVKKGFSLLEVLIAMFIFVLMMIFVSAAFSSTFFSYRSARSIQKDLEQAQNAMNLMAKTLRTGSFIWCSNGSSLAACSSTPATYSWIRIYDYSQGECVDYRITNGAVQEAFTSDALSDCVALSTGSMVAATSNLTSAQNYINGGFYVIYSNKSPKVVGRSTIFFTVCPGNSSACASNSIDKVNIQTTVSLRDYSVSGLE